MWRWDAMAVIEVIEHIPDEQIDKFFQNIYRVLKDDGKINLSGNVFGVMA